MGNMIYVSLTPRVRSEERKKENSLEIAMRSKCESTAYMI